MAMNPRALLLCAAIATLLCLSSCGYTLVTEKGIVGGEVMAVDVPVFKNRSYEAQAPFFFTQAFSRELAGSGLFDINRKDADSTLQGTIVALRSTPSALSGQGLAVQKTIEITIELVLSKKTGSQVKRWTLTDSEAYAVDTINLEEYNRSEAMGRIAARMARRFSNLAFNEF